jgi:hypothetical protein
MGTARLEFGMALHLRGIAWRGWGEGGCGAIFGLCGVYTSFLTRPSVRKWLAGDWLAGKISR